MPKLNELELVDLRRELDERIEDSTNLKTVLQDRFWQVMNNNGEDPDSYVFGWSDLECLKQKWNKMPWSSKR